MLHIKFYTFPVIISFTTPAINVPLVVIFRPPMGLHMICISTICGTWFNIFWKLSKTAKTTSTLSSTCTIFANFSINCNSSIGIPAIKIENLKSIL